MYKIAVLGDRDSIYGFAALGLDTYPVYDPTEAVRTLRRLARGKLRGHLYHRGTGRRDRRGLDRYRSQRLPAIILIPGVSGNTGRGIAGVKRSVEQAVGSDIIFGNDN